MISLQNLTKDYGSVRAVDHINFEINEGEILGFLGPNGAGKTTTLRMITCFLSPTSGNIEVENMNIKDKQIEIPLSDIDILIVFSDNASREDIDKILETIYSIGEKYRGFSKYDKVIDVP